MIVVLIVLVVILAVALAGVAAPRLLRRTRRPSQPPVRSGRRVLFPFVAEDLSQRALDAALRLAVAEQATLFPVFLARVSLDLRLDAPLPHQCSMAVPLLEAIEQRATEAGVPVDSRIERGRNRRHALRQAIANERFDRIVMAAASHGSPGFDADDVAWLLDNAAGEIVVLRPATPAAIGLRTGRAKPVGSHLSDVRVRSERHARLNRAGEMAGSR
jgi:hypothetical protein